MMRRWFCLGGAFCLWLSAADLSAQSVSFDLGSTPGDRGGFQRSIHYDNACVEMTASAWSYGTRGSPDAFSRAMLGQWPTGLGVLNKDEFRGRWFFDHQVDNRREADFVLFLFDQPVDLEKVVVDPWGIGDSDVMYWSGLVTGPVDLTGLSMDDLASMGYDATLDAGPVGCSPRTVMLSSAGPVNALLLGVPLPGEGPDRYEDKFKIRLLEVACIPEPSSVGLLLVGAAGVLFLRRKT